MADVARGERIQQLRNERRITQDDMPWELRKFNGDKHVITRRGYQLWEAGEGISWKRAKILAAFFDVPPEEIAERAEEPKSSPLALFNRGVDASQLDSIERMLRLLLAEAGVDPGEELERALDPDDPATGQQNDDTAEAAPAPRAKARRSAAPPR
jgi:transcriptional regulator with XRE-family HTH domain